MVQIVDDDKCDTCGNVFAITELRQQWKKNKNSGLMERDFECDNCWQDRLNLGGK